MLNYIKICLIIIRYTTCYKNIRRIRKMRKLKANIYKYGKANILY